jgi:hypothetical protein
MAMGFSLAFKGLIKEHAMKMYGGVVVEFQGF